MSDRYIALLRGINVGRANRVAMADLRTLVVQLGYTGVRTLLNSGNVIFDASATDPSEISARLEHALHARLNVSVQVIVLTSAELKEIEIASSKITVKGDRYSGGSAKLINR